MARRRYYDAFLKCNHEAPEHHKASKQFLLLGRKPVLFYLSNILIFIATGFTVLAFDKYYLSLILFSRFLHGVSIGIVLAVLPVYTTEMGGKHIRGILGGIRGSLAFTGATLTLLVSLPSIWGNEEYLRILLLLPLFCAIPLFLLGLFAPESPKFTFAQKSDLNQLNYSMRHFYENASEMVDLSDISERTRTHGLLECLRNKAIRRGMTVGFVIAMVRTFTGSPIVEVFSAHVLQNTEASEHTVNMFIVIHEALGIVASIVGVTLIHRLGRRRTLLSGMLAHIVLWIVYLVLFYTNLHFHSSLITWITLLVFFAQILIIYPVATGIIPFFISSELVDTGARQVASAVSMVGLWVAFTLFTFLFSMIFNVIGELAIIVVSILPLVICGIYLHFYMPETKNKSIAEVLAAFDY